MNREELLALIDKAAREGWTELDLRSQGLTELPPEIGRLTTLEKLDLGYGWERPGAYNRLTTLPPEIGQLTALTDLGLSSNHLTALPPEIGQLTALTDLDLSSNHLTVLPPEIGQLTALQFLFLDSNHLTTLPPEICQLFVLRELNLCGNALTALPPKIGQLTTLRKLNLRNNDLIALPMGIRRLTNLQTLDLQGNLDFPLPPEILAKTDAAQAIIRAYLDYLATQKPLVNKNSVDQTSVVGRQQHNTGQTSVVGRPQPNLGGIDDALLSDLHAALLLCPPFTSDADLRTLFADKRIYPWRDDLPQTNTPAARVRAVVDYLHNRYTTTGDNALVLFLHVLAEHAPHEDALHTELRTLAADLERALTARPV